MWFSRKQVVKVSAAEALAAAVPVVGPAKIVAKRAANPPAGQITTKLRGDSAETIALAHLTKAGLKLADRNYRTPGRGGGEIDLVMHDRDGTLVFVEVRQRSSRSHGGAGASISGIKRQRIIFAARHYLMRFATPPPCRFDVVLMQGGMDAGDANIDWLRAAFDAS